jgi:CHAD domain-containing protein
MRSPFAAFSDDFIHTRLTKFIRKADKAAAKCGKKGKAVHDFRVALRGLHSWLIVYAAPYGFDPQLILEVQALASATNGYRDLQVFSLWLDEQKHPSHAVRKYRKHIRRQLEKITKKTGTFIKDSWLPLSERLYRELDVICRGDDSECGFSATSHAALRQRFDVLSDQLGNIIGVEENDTSKKRLHKCRISIKQMRYLLEAFGDWNSQCLEAVDDLRKIQNELGLYHDLCVFRRTICSAASGHQGLESLAEMAEEQRARLFAHLNGKYFSPPLGWLDRLDSAIGMIGAEA